MVSFEHHREYLDKMTAQLNEELALQGYLVTADLCRRYNFGIAFVRQVCDRTLAAVTMIATNLCHLLTVQRFKYSSSKTESALLSLDNGILSIVDW